MFLSHREFRRQWSSGRRRRHHLDQGEAPARTAFRIAAHLFAVHQFIEGFVWLGLDGILSPAVAHDMGAAFMLYAQGLLPFLLPLSVLLSEPNAESRRQDVADTSAMPTISETISRTIAFIVPYSGRDFDANLFRQVVRPVED